MLLCNCSNIIKSPRLSAEHTCHAPHLDSEKYDLET